MVKIQSMSKIHTYRYSFSLYQLVIGTNSTLSIHNAKMQALTSTPTSKSKTKNLERFHDARAFIVSENSLKLRKVLLSQHPEMLNTSQGTPVFINVLIATNDTAQLKNEERWTSPN